MKPTRLLLGATVLVSAVAIAACCKSGSDSGNETPTAEPTTTTPPAETAETPPEAVDPGWKQKCPDGDRPEGGTVTVLKQLQIYEKPTTDSKKLSDIVPGTWVNLLAAKATWLCIDYPCDVGKLCPGWIEASYTKRKEPEPKDAGVDAKAEAGLDAGPEAGPEAGTDGGRPRFMVVVDAGGGSTGTPPGGKAPPGGRPPTPPKPK